MDDQATNIHSLLDPLFERYRRSDSPGMVVGIARHGRVVYRTAFGMASVQHAVTNTPNTRMRIGSTTKHFASLAALLLQERGKLDIDAPADRYIAELDRPNNRTDMPTLRQFMRHTSGRCCALELAVMANGDVMIPRGYLIGAMARQVGRCFPLGEGQLYNNGGYHLLSIAIERAAGVPFGTFLRDEIFLPLGMTDTECAPDFLTVLPGLASPHVPDPAGGWRLGTMPTEDLLGEGSIVSTVDDMLKWLAHMNGPKRVGSERSWEEMLAVRPLESGRKSSYTHGLFRHSYRGLEVIHHGGSFTGGNSQMLTVPGEGLDVVIMNNGALASTQQLARDVLDRLLADRFSSAADPIASAADYRHLIGTKYCSLDAGTTVAFEELPDGTLGTSLWYLPPMPVLRERPDGKVSARFEDIAAGPVEFDRNELAADADGAAPATLRMTDMGHPVTLTKLPATPPQASEFATTLVGRYWCADLAADAEIVYSGDTLLFRVRGEYSGWQEHPLRPLASSVLALDGGPGINLSRGSDGKVDRFILDALRARRLEFVRGGRA
jgi:CubicO group peptidase (beta-lactamase class C family)